MTARIRLVAIIERKRKMGCTKEENECETVENKDIRHVRHMCASE